MNNARAQARSLNLFFIFTFVFIFLNTIAAFAGPSRTTYQARIVKPDGYPLEGTNINFKFTILDTSGSCILYAETYSAVNMGSSGGLVSFSLGTGVRTFPVSGSTFEQVFSNTTASLTCDAGGPATYSPSANDTRKIVMQFNDGAGWQTLPAMTINAVPYAMYANDSLKFNGKDITDFVQVASLPTCGASEAVRFNGAGFSCITVGGTSTSVTSGAVVTALGFTPADGASVTALNSNISNVSSTVTSVSSTVAAVSSAVYSVSSTVTSLQNSVVASFAAITSSQWTTSGTNIFYSGAGNVGVATSDPTSLFQVGAVSAFAVDANSNVSLNGAPFPAAPLNRGIFFSHLQDSAGVFAGKIGFSTPSGVPGLTLYNNQGLTRTDVRLLTQAGGLAFGTGTTSSAPSVQMVLTASGDVGINTTTPVTKLDVSGAIRIGVDSSACSAGLAGALRYNGGAVEYCNGSSWAAFGVSGSGLTLLNGSASNTQTFANGTAGNSPAFNTANGVHTLNIPFASQATTTAGLISYSDYLSFSNKQSATSAAIAATMGYTPADSATVTTLSSTVGSVSSTVASVSSTVNSVSNTVASLQNSTAASFAAITSSQWTTSGTKIYYTSGNVGIGTSAPTTGLDVNAGGRFVGSLAAIGGIDMQHATISRADLIQTDSPTSFILKTSAASAPIIFQAAGTERMRVDYTGNVGIGTTSPNYKLDVVASGSANTQLAQFLYLDNDAGATRPRLQILGAANKISLQTSYNSGGADLVLGTASSNTALTIKENGSIGIGTTTPQSGFILDVGGQSVTRGSAYVSGSVIEFGSGAYKLSNSGNSYLVGGNVGIGTSSPVKTLEVSGTLRVSGVSGTAGKLDLSAAGVGVDMYNYFDSSDDNDDVHYLFRTNLTSGAGSGTFTGLDLWRLGSTTQHRLGVNKATPAANLDVSGSAIISGNVAFGTTNSSARLHLGAGTTSLAPFKFTSGTLLASPQSGTMEYDGAGFYLTDGAGVRRMIATGGSAGTIDNASVINSTGNISMVPVGSVIVSSTTASSNYSNGALVVNGGLGVSGAINANGNITTNGSLTVSSDITANNLKSYVFTRAMPGAVDDYVEIAKFSYNNRAFNFRITLTVETAGVAITKSYLLPSRYQPAVTWYTLLPIAQSIWGSDNAEIDVQPGTGDPYLYLRLRRTAGSSAATATVKIDQEGYVNTNFVAMTGTGSTSAPANFYESTALTQYNGKVGIGILNPSRVLDVLQGDNTNELASFMNSNSTSSTTDGALVRIHNTSPSANKSTFRLGKRNYLDSGFNYGDFRLNNTGDIEFAVGTSSANLVTAEMVLSASGNLGVGTSAPASRLHVTDNVPVLLTLERQNNQNSLIEFKNAAGSVYAGEIIGTTDFGVGTGTDLSASGVFRVANSGRVYIGGSTTPTARLHITPGTSSVAPIKLGPGTLTSTPQSGTIEYDGTDYYITDSNNVRRAIATTNGGTLNNTSVVSSTSGIALWPAAGNSVTVSSTVASTNSSTGALIVNGGAGIAGALNVGGVISGSSTIKGTGFRANQGAPDAADSSTNGYAFGADGDTGIFSPGSGSANGVLSFYSNNGEKMRITASGSVGIGISAPTAPLHISNTSSVVKLTLGKDDNSTSESSFLKIDTAGTSSYTAGVAMTSGGNSNSGALMFRPSSTGGLYFKGFANFVSASAQVVPDLFISAASNIGFGTNNPVAQLDVLTSATLTQRLYHVSNNANDDANLILSRARGTTSAATAVQSGDALGGVYFRGHDGSGASSSSAYIAVTAEENFTGGTKGTSMRFGTTVSQTGSYQEIMRIHSNGFVGIGNTSPNALLQVGPSGSQNANYNIYLASWRSSAGQGQIVGNWNNSNYWGLGPATNSGSDNTLRLGIASDRTGTWSGTQNLNLVMGGALAVGSATVGTYAFQAVKNFNGVSSETAAFIGGVDAGYTNTGLYIAQKDNTGLGANTTNLLNAVTNGASKFVVTGAGNVGVGVTAPTQTLQVSGTGLFTNKLWGSYGNANVGGYSWTDAAVTTNSIEIVNNNSADATKAATLAFHTYGFGGPQFRLDPSGSKVLYLESANANSSRNPAAYGGGANTYFTRLHVDGQVTTTGSIGIGTSAPVANMQIRGGVSYGAFMLGDNGGTSNHHLTHETDGSFGIFTGTFGSGTRQLTITSGGAMGVGMGNNVPTYKFQVTKTSSATPAMMISGGFAGGPRLQAYGLDADPAAWMGIGTDMGGGPYELSLYTSAIAQNGKITFGQYNNTTQTYTERMRIAGDGKVGIGTNNPQAQLHVAGDVRIVDGNQAAGRVLASDANGTAAWKQTIIHGTINSTGNTSNGGQVASGVYITLPPGKWQITGMGITTPTSCRADFGIRNQATTAIVKYTLMPAPTGDFTTATVVGYVDIASTTTYELYITSRGACASQIHVDNNLWELTATGVAY